MPDYSKGKIYTIRCLNDPNVYVGSTIQSLAVRMGSHRTAYKKNKVLGLNKEIVKDITEWKIELYELYPCNTNLELHRREGEIIRLLGTLNKCIPGRTQKEYYIDNAKKIKDHMKEYSIENIDKIKENRESIESINYHKEYQEKNKEKIQKRTKEYRDKNKEKMKEIHRQYYLKNKDKKKEYVKEYYLKKKSNIIIKEDE